MKLIFLDLDGVLNYEKFFAKRPKNLPTWHQRYFCPQAVKRLNQITDETNAKIVFSSSHRFRFETLQELKESFSLAGVTGELIGITPRLRYQNNSPAPRGCEIKDWIETNGTPVKYAILDDDSDMLYCQRKSFFRTGWIQGLTQGIANRVIKHLNK